MVGLFAFTLCHSETFSADPQAACYIHGRHVGKTRRIVALLSVSAEPLSVEKSCRDIAISWGP